MFHFYTKVFSSIRFSFWRYVKPCEQVVHEDAHNLPGDVALLWND